MNSTRCGWITLPVLLALSSWTGAQTAADWVDIKDPKELRALFSNKTHRGKGADGTPYVAHFSADGRGVLLWVRQSYPRTWEVKGSEVCITAATGPVTGTVCRSYHRHRKDRSDLLGRTREGWVNPFMVEDGIPKF